MREGLALSVDILDEDARLERLADRVDEAARAQPAHALEHREVELASTDGCELEQRRGLGRETVDAAPDHRPDLLGDAPGRILISGTSPFRELVGIDGADQLAEEERVAARDRMQSRGE